MAKRQLRWILYDEVVKQLMILPPRSGGYSVAALEEALEDEIDFEDIDPDLVTNEIWDRAIQFAIVNKERTLLIKWRQEFKELKRDEQLELISPERLVETKSALKDLDLEDGLIKSRGDRGDKPKNIGGRSANRRTWDDQKDRFTEPQRRKRVIRKRRRK